MNALTQTILARPIPPLPRRPVRVVVCGEVNSGKSSVIDALFRQSVVPTFFGQSRRPVIRLRHGKPHAVVTFNAEGSALYDNVTACPELARASACEIVRDAPHLAGIELIEVSLPEGEPIPPLAQKALAEADLLIWTTIASQAWRFTERAMVAQLPRSLHQRATLVVTRADKLKSPADLRRVHRRLVLETFEFFDHIAFLTAPRRLIDASKLSDEAYAATGGAAIAAALSEFVAEIAGIPGRLGRETAPTLVAPPPLAADDPAARTVAELREMVAGMSGILSAAIAGGTDGTTLYHLGGAATGAASLPRAATDDDVAVIEQEAEGRFLTLCRLDGGARQLVLTCRSGRISPSLARNAAQRMAHLWEQRDR